MIACVDGGLFCIGVPALIIFLFPAIGVWLKKRCRCRKCYGTTSKESTGTDK